MLKQQIYILLLLTLGIGPCPAQSNDSLVWNIDTKYQLIHDNLTSYDSKSVYIMDESAEGGEAKAFFDDNNIKLIEVLWFGETGKRKIDYYFDNGKLFFVLNSQFKYNRPIYYDSIMANENKDHEFFGPGKTTVNENRFYFSNGKLVRWIDHDKKEVDLTQGTNTIEGQELMEHSIKVMSQFRK